MAQPLLTQKLTRSYIEQGVINSYKIEKALPHGNKEFIIEVNGTDYPAYCQSNRTIRFSYLKELNLNPGVVISLYEVVPKSKYRLEYDSDALNVGNRTHETSPTAKVHHKTEKKIGKRAKNPKVATIADRLLDTIREEMNKLGSGYDQFYLRRWIYVRLQIEEQNEKKKIKNELWERGKQKCSYCDRTFASLKQVHIHRKNAEQEYSVDNCILLHKECHNNTHHPKKMT